MRSRLVVALASAGVIVVGGGDAVASTPLLNVCYDVGYACFNAGPAGDEEGTCVAATCTGVLDASYACGTCEPGDAGSHDDGGPDAAWSDDGPSGTGDAAAVDGAAPIDGGPDDAAPVDGNLDAEAGASSNGGGTSSGGGASGGSSSGNATGSSSGGEAPDAGPDVAPTMAGCAVSTSQSGTTGASIVAFLGAAVTALRRRRRFRR